MASSEAHTPSGGVISILIDSTTIKQEETEIKRVRSMKRKLMKGFK